MTIVLTGGGSGGHITPLLAVAHELHRLNPDVKIIFVGQTGDRFSELPSTDPNISAVYTIRAGKFRRYHSQGLGQFLDISTMIKNIRDIIFVGVGLIQSFFILRKIRPDVIFTRGAYVGVPLCAVAAKMNVPIITHDSDITPNLSNRIVSRWATLHAVAMPKQYYKYPSHKTVTTGVPVGFNFQLITDQLKTKFRTEIDVDDNKQLLLITGGGLGAKKINEVIIEATPQLLANNKNLIIVHNTGGKHQQAADQEYDKLSTDLRNRVIVKGFIDDLYRYSGAADLIVTRAGATTIAEFAMQAKACIVIPNPYLTGGHQVKNAEILTESGAAEVIPEDQLTPDNLVSRVDDLLRSTDKREAMGKALNQLANPNSAKIIAQILIDTVDSNK